MGLKFYCYAGLVVLALVFAYYFRHSIIKAEDNKLTVASQNVVLNIEDKKNEIRNIPVSDARTIARLHAGTYFNH